MTIYQRSLVSDRSGSGHPIRLLELLPDTTKQPIRCRIQYANLDDASIPSYDALSYCWGDVSSTKAIIIDDATSFGITANLHSALKRLRGINVSKILWVDAICINQHDTAEKNEQVALMRDIYSSAKNVSIWLGEGFRNSRAAFRLMHDILDAKMMDELRGLEKRDLWDLNENHYNLPLTTDPVWYDLFAIIQRPWFRRAWVIQELAMASEATIMCGEDTVSWEELDQVFKYLAAGGLALTFAPLALNHFLVLSHAREVAQSKSTQSALPVLMRHRQSLASDPRDKIFAFGGLCRASGDDSLAIRPDYGTNFREIYTMFAVRILQSNQNLDILSVPRVQETSAGGSLPTWVPDWSVFDQATSLQGWETDAKQEWIIRSKFTATGLSRCKPTFNNDYTRLGLRGAIVDRVFFAAPECVNQPDQDALMKTNDLSLVIQSQKVLKKMEDISWCRVFWKQYPTGEKVMDVYWQTLLAGTIYGSFEVTRDIFHRWDRTNMYFRLLQLVRLDRLWFLKMVQFVTVLICTIASYFGWTGVIDYMINFTPETLFRTLASPMLNRCLFTTEAGFTGLGPKLIKGDVDEDYVALCEGASLPLIVRPKGDDWEVIGDCYVHGWMNGELYEIVRKDMKTMWFV